MVGKPGLLATVRGSYNGLKLGLWCAGTAAAVGFTAYASNNLYNSLSEEGTLERAATAYYIAADKSMQKIREESKKISEYTNQWNNISKELDEIRTSDQETLEKAIKKYNAQGRLMEAGKAGRIKEQLGSTDKRLKELYTERKDKLDDMVKKSKDLGKYSTLWRRAVKINTYFVYEFSTYTREWAEKGEQRDDLIGDTHRYLKKFGEWWIENVLRKKLEDSEKKMEQLRTRISVYTQAEQGKQGLANITKYLNDELAGENLGEGEKQLYLLVRDSIAQTGGVKTANDMLNYLTSEEIPEYLPKEVKGFLTGQKRMFDIIDESYKLFTKRYELVVEAEELGITLEKSDLDELDPLIKKAREVVRKMDESNKQLEEASINPQDPEYLEFKQEIKQYYYGSVAGLCGLEMLIGGLLALGSRRKWQFYNLQKDHANLSADHVSLSEEHTNLVDSLKETDGGEKNA